MVSNCGPTIDRRGRFFGIVLSVSVVCIALYTSAQTAHADPSLNLAAFPTPISPTSPVDIANAGDSRIFVVEQGGTIQVYQSDGTPLGTFLDITDRVLSGGERGLLSLAFDPDYTTNGFLFVYYTRDPDGAIQVSRFTAVGTPATSNDADETSESPVITIPHPTFSNHNGGDLNFRADTSGTYLYISTGDGGGGGDPDENAQDPQSLLGKLLRLDVSAAGYTIPPDNPFVGPDGVLDEIWALGMRNPFRFTFDSTTGDLWLGDVGQGTWEEVDREPAGDPGGKNYGWDCYEGPDPFELGGCGPVGDYTFPVHSYAQTGPLCAVTGGYVYRGSDFSSLIGGHYFFADFCTGDTYSLSPGSCPGSFVLHSYGQLGISPSAFGVDSAGELLVADLFGDVSRIEATGTPFPALPPCGGCAAEPLEGCRQPAPTKASLLIKNDPDDNSKDKLIWKWLKGDITPKTAFGDPDVADYDLCIYVGTAVTEAQIPGQVACPSCWSETGKGFKYNVDTPGIQKMILKSGDEAGKAKIILKGKGIGLPGDLPTVPIAESSVTVQLTNSEGECWEATYSDPYKKNENNNFKDKSD